MSSESNGKRRVQEGLLESATRAIAERVWQSTVCLISRDEARRMHQKTGVADPMRLQNGSGTLLVTPNGHHLVLTARHIFLDEDRNVDSRNESFELVYRNNNFEIKDCIETLELYPDMSIDIALVTLKSTLTLPEKLIPLPISSVISRESLPPASEYACIAGYPSSWREWTDKGLAYKALVYPSVKSTLDKNLARWCFDYDSEIDNEDEELLAPNPQGMSGGGLWIYDNSIDSKRPIWTPSDSVRLIGVQCGWYERTRRLIVEPASRWMSWFQETIARIEG